MELQTIFELAVSPEENCRRDALVSLGNLAVISYNQSLIVKLGGLPYIVKAIDSSFESCQRFAARVVYRLCAHADIQVRLIHLPKLPHC